MQLVRVTCIFTSTFIFSYPTLILQLTKVSKLEKNCNNAKMQKCKIILKKMQVWMMPYGSQVLECILQCIVAMHPLLVLEPYTFQHSEFDIRKCVRTFLKTVPLLTYQYVCLFSKDNLNKPSRMLGSEWSKLLKI